MKEKRKYKRIQYREAVQYQVSPRVQDAVLHVPHFGGCLSWDISEGGMRFRSDDFIPLNTELILKFSLGTECLVALEAKVVWIQKLPHADQYYLGLEFSSAPDDLLMRKKVHMYIDKYFRPEIT